MLACGLLVAPKTALFPHERNIVKVRKHKSIPRHAHQVEGLVEVGWWVMFEEHKRQAWQGDQVKRQKGNKVSVKVDLAKLVILDQPFRGKPFYGQGHPLLESFDMKGQLCEDKLAAAGTEVAV